MTEDEQKAIDKQLDSFEECVNKYNLKLGGSITLADLGGTDKPWDYLFRKELEKLPYAPTYGDDNYIWKMDGYSMDLMRTLEWRLKDAEK